MCLHCCTLHLDCEAICPAPPQVHGATRRLSTAPTNPPEMVSLLEFMASTEQRRRQFTDRADDVRGPLLHHLCRWQLLQSAVLLASCRCCVTWYGAWLLSSCRAMASAWQLSLGYSPCIMVSLWQ